MAYLAGEDVDEGLVAEGDAEDAEVVCGGDDARVLVEDAEYERGGAGGEGVQAEEGVQEEEREELEDRGKKGGKRCEGLGIHHIHPIVYSYHLAWCQVQDREGGAHSELERAELALDMHAHIPEDELRDEEVA